MALKDHWDEVCDMVVGGKTLHEIAAHFGVTASAITNAAGKDPELGAKYASARDASADAFEAEILRVMQLADNETYQVDRLKIDTMKWVAGRRAPKRYGDRIQQDVTHDVREGLAEKMAAARMRVKAPQE